MGQLLALICTSSHAGLNGICFLLLPRASLSTFTLLFRFLDATNEDYVYRCYFLVYYAWLRRFGIVLLFFTFNDVSYIRSVVVSSSSFLGTLDVVQGHTQKKSISILTVLNLKKINCLSRPISWNAHTRHRLRTVGISRI